MQPKLTLGIPRVARYSQSRQQIYVARGNRFAFAQLSDISGAYEVTLFSEALEASRDHLETGSKVLVTVEASLEADQLKLLGRSVAPIDATLAGAGAMGLKVFVTKSEAFANIATVLNDASQTMKHLPKGPLQFCLMGETLEGEVTLDAGEEFPMNPQIKGALKSLDGVLQVEEI